MKTDPQLLKDVTEELDWDAAIDAAQIEIAVQEGLVTVGGQVRSYSEKWLAEQAIQRVAGVKALVVKIIVAPPGSHSDAEIARAAGSALSWLSYLPENAVKIQVEDGWIKLAGSVAWDYQRQNAAGAVQNLAGVKGISNDISLDSDLPSTQIKADIEAALERRFDAADQDISVAVTGKDVTLSGTVTSWWQRHLARTSAWNAAGVRNVKDHLHIAD
jgi:osmotically-inducible protein OsmY